MPKIENPVVVGGMMFDITPYVPPHPPAELNIHGFWLVPDENSPSGRRAVPIPDDVFGKYLETLED